MTEETKGVRHISVQYCLMCTLILSGSRGVRVDVGKRVCIRLTDDSGFIGEV